MLSFERVKSDSVMMKHLSNVRESQNAKAKGRGRRVSQRMRGGGRGKGVGKRILEVVPGRRRKDVLSGGKRRHRTVFEQIVEKDRKVRREDKTVVDPGAPKFSQSPSRVRRVEGGHEKTVLQEESILKKLEEESAHLWSDSGSDDERDGEEGEEDQFEEEDEEEAGTGPLAPLSVGFFAQSENVTLLIIGVVAAAIRIYNASS